MLHLYIYSKITILKGSHLVRLTQSFTLWVIERLLTINQNLHKEMVGDFPKINLIIWETLEKVTLG